MTERIMWYESKGVQKQGKFNNKKESMHIKLNLNSSSLPWFSGALLPVAGPKYPAPWGDIGIKISYTIDSQNTNI